MKKKMPVTTSYEKLMSQRYGNIHKDPAKSGHARGYGSAHGYRAGHGHGYGHGADAPPLALSKSFDDGELLPQKDSPFAEYVVQSSVTGSVDGGPGQTEYVVGNCDELSRQGANSWPAAAAMSRSAGGNMNWSAAADMNWPPTLTNQGSGQGPEDIQYEMIPPGIPGGSPARQEWQVDLLHPLQGSGQGANAGGPAGSAFGGFSGSPFAGSPGVGSWGTSDPLFASSTSAEPYPEMPAEESKKGRASDEDFMADMQSILLGQKVFDPVTKKTVDKGGSGSGQKNMPVTEGPGEHAIFDKIAQSMQYSNKYDLGTMELENRFADFDKLTDQKDIAGMAKKAAAPTASGAGSSSSSSSSAPGPASLSVDDALKVGNEDFLRDLDAIRDLDALRQPEARSQPEATRKNAADDPQTARADRPDTPDRQGLPDLAGLTEKQ